MRHADPDPLLSGGYEEMQARRAKIPPHERPRLTEGAESRKWRDGAAAAETKSKP